MKVILKSTLSFFRDNGSIHAGSMTYFFSCNLSFSASFLSRYLATSSEQFYAFFSARAMRFFPATTDEIAGALRGGISRALALSLPNEAYKDFFVGITFIIVILSVLVQELTMERFVRLIGG